MRAVWSAIALAAALGCLGATRTAARADSGQVQRRDALVRLYGGTEASERAVELALQWLAEHQCADGGWNFDLSKCENCKGRCPDSGKHKEARFAATGLGLLPFLASGQTHQQGKYKETVARGIKYLTDKMELKEGRGALVDAGRMYSHGIAAIALCDAYAASQDKALQAPAQAAIRYIEYAQDPVGGGWRYVPRQPGDTSVSGMQLQAIHSVQRASLAVPAKITEGASRFLDSVQADDGAAYGYTQPGARPTTSAIGLLCRLRLGWKPDHETLERGVAALVEQGPSAENFYHNYYATMLMHAVGGKPWEKWNTTMRDQLVNSQSRQRHSEGSWYAPGSYNEMGGRLYCTSLAALMLEVYYRYPAPARETDAKPE